MTLEIWLPRAVRPAYRCEIPGCGAEFTEDERAEFQRHVPRCARRHADELRAEAVAFGNEPTRKAFDVEAETWLRRQLEDRP